MGKQDKFKERKKGCGIQKRAKRLRTKTRQKRSFNSFEFKKF